MAHAARQMYVQTSTSRWMAASAAPTPTASTSARSVAKRILSAATTVWFASFKQRQMLNCHSTIQPKTRTDPDESRHGTAPTSLAKMFEELRH